MDFNKDVSLVSIDTTILSWHHYFFLKSGACTQWNALTNSTNFLKYWWARLILHNHISHLHFKRPHNYIATQDRNSWLSWWRYRIEIFFGLLALLCGEIHRSPVNHYDVIIMMADSPDEPRFIRYEMMVMVWIQPRIHYITLPLWVRIREAVVERHLYFSGQETTSSI